MFKYIMHKYVEYARVWLCNLANATVQLTNKKALRKEVEEVRIDAAL